MSDPRLFRRLDQVAFRLRSVRGLWMATIGWALLAIALFVCRLLGQYTMGWIAVLFGVPLVLIAAVIKASRRQRDFLDAAILIEKNYPELDSRLITAIQQRPEQEQWNLTFLQTELLSQVFGQLRQQNWHQAVGSREFWLAHAANAVAVVVCLVLLPPWSHLESGPNTDAPPFVESRSENSDGALVIEVEPGNAEIERGTSLLVIARFPERIPGQVQLVAVGAEGNEVRTPLEKSLKDPLFGGRIPNVEGNLKYRVEFDGQSSEEFLVTTFEYPELRRADASAVYPEYTELAPRKFEDIRTLSVVEGTKLDFLCELSKPVASAVLVDDQQMELSLETNIAALASTQFKLDTVGEMKFKLRLTDADGRTNQDETEFRITIVPNRVPDLKIEFPSRDLRVSPLQELDLQARAADDFGLKGMGLIFQTPQGIDSEIDFAQSAGPDDLVKASHLISMESMQTQPDDVVSYYFYADDIGPDGATRRTFSDIFFAEVRSFEEIFRQGERQNGQQQNQQQGQQQSGESGELLELQRQVVTASWNVLRQEQREPVSDSFSQLAKELAEAQKEVRGIAEQSETRVTDPIQKKHLTKAMEEMASATSAFEAASREMQLKSMKDGQVLSQQAYQSLLRMQAREHQVSESSSSSSSAGASSRSEQMQSLQLKNDRDRYQTESQAGREQQESEQQSLKILNRLKELAQRQEDVNQRIRELETALQNAATEEERKDVERELKRLQAEQEELLRSLDDVRERMNQDQNRSEMTESRKQADEIRERIRNSSEALKQGQTSKALTEGTHAQREMKDLEETLRDQTSGAFTEAMRDLRERVRELSQAQDELSQQLEESSTGSTSSRQRPSLVDEKNENEEGEQLAQEFTRQKERLEEILNRSKEIVEQAELTEPLLSKKLYETLREQRLHQTEDALEAAIQYTRRGIQGPVKDIEREIAEGIDSLKSGIESAAESVLGNEDEALKQAQQELRNLRESLEEELAQHGRSVPGPNGSRNQDAAEESQEQSNNEGASGEPRGSSGAMEQRQREPGENSGSGQANEPPADGEQNSESAEGSGNRSGEMSEQPGNNEAGERGQQNTGERDPSGNRSGSTPEPTNQPPRGGGQSPSDSPQEGLQPGDQPAGDLSGSTQSGNGRTEVDGSQEESADLLSSLEQLLGGDQSLGGMGAAGTGLSGPIVGEDFSEWTNRLRDVEQMLTSPELRSRAAEIRDQVRLERVNVKRHSKAPNWEAVRTSVYGPLRELEQLIAEERSRRDPQNNLVPIDRDPIPEKYNDFQRRYYEELSRQQSP
ncbi:hypothetical protein SH668x_002312 [Planctomicrobium sp. SH668]|uniref:hypothetical protein n=1 Tax=Planctomicrobium sp. SH668 TaxID=3448126 RepID=UPI003F5CAEF7